MNESRTGSSTYGATAVLSVGFLALAIAVILAHAEPATGYELSLYAMTPIETWIGIGIALALSLVVSLADVRDRLRAMALALGGLSVTVVAGLPIVRGYHFNGHADSLTHLGWAGDLVSGAMTPFELIYPGIHMVTAFVNGVLGAHLPRAMLYTVVVYVLVFFVFVTLAVRVIAPTGRAVAFGFFSALLLLPITTISTHMHAHSMTQAILFSALLLYLSLKYLVGRTDRGTTLALGALFAVVAGATVLYHPQLAVHFLIALVAVSVLQFAYRRFRSDHPTASYRPLYAPTLILAVAFLLWSSNHGFFADPGERAIVSAVEYIFGERVDPAGEEIVAQGGSLLAIGGSIAELFVKLFLTSAFYAALTGVLVLEAITLRRDDGSLDVTVARFFALGLIGLAVMFGVYFVSTTSEMYFRVFGLMMLFVTVLGAVALERWTRGLALRTSSALVRPLTIAIFAVVLALSLAAIFPSPYIYSQSHHVTEMEMNGYETAFEHQDEEFRFVGIRDGPHRYVDAIEGGGRTSDRAGGVSGEQLASNLGEEFPNDRYLVITRIDREREVLAWQEIRYTRAQLDAVTTQRSAHRVQSNGEFDLFYVRAS